MSKPTSLRANALAAMKKEDEAISLIWIERDQMAPDPQHPQPRSEFPAQSLQEIGADLKENGQAYPILVRENNGKGPAFWIFDGERRWRSSAPEFGDIPRLLAMVYPHDVDAEAVHDRQFMINFSNEAMSLVDQARYFRRKVELLGSVEAVAEKLKIGVGRIYRVIKANKVGGLAGDVRDAGLTKDAETLTTLATLERRDPAAAKQLVEKAKGEGKLTRKETATAVAAAKSGPMDKDGGAGSKGKEVPGKKTRDRSAPEPQTRLERLSLVELDLNYPRATRGSVPMVYVRWAGNPYSAESKLWCELDKGDGKAHICFSRIHSEEFTPRGAEVRVLVAFDDDDTVLATFDTAYIRLRVVIGSAKAK